MDKENLRMQMLSGIITEGEYKAKLSLIKENEELKEFNILDPFGFRAARKDAAARKEAEEKAKAEKEAAEKAARIAAQDKKIKLEMAYKAYADLTDEISKLNVAAYTHNDASSERKAEEKTKKLPAALQAIKDAGGNHPRGIKWEDEKLLKESLNEHYVAGGIVGIQAINTIPPREKESYETAFEYFLSERYEKEEVKEEEVNEEEINEEEIINEEEDNTEEN